MCTIPESTGHQVAETPIVAEELCLVTLVLMVRPQYVEAGYCLVQHRAYLKLLHTNILGIEVGAVAKSQEASSSEVAPPLTPSCILILHAGV